MKARRIKPNGSDYYVSDFAPDIQRTTKNPSKNEGDGREYIVRDVLGNYLENTLYNGWSSSIERAQLFYDGQAAWGAARKSIYPAEVLVVIDINGHKGVKPND